jgi:hypothetical protein
MNDCSCIGESRDARLVITVATKPFDKAWRLRKGLSLAVYTLFRSSLSVKCSRRHRLLQFRLATMSAGALLLRDFHARIAPVEIHFLC